MVEKVCKEYKYMKNYKIILLFSSMLCTGCLIVDKAG